MPFNIEKTYDVVIVEAYVAEPKFEHALCDIALKLETEEGEQDFFTMEVSGNYGRGNYGTMTQTEIAMKKLKELGLKADNIDDAICNLELLVGFKTTATVKKTEKNGKTYYNVSYLGGYAPKKLDSKEIANRLSKLFSDSSVSSQPSAQTAGVKANPFL